jgi:hypothetical protein
VRIEEYPDTGKGLHSTHRQENLLLVFPDFLEDEGNEARNP